MFWFKLLKKLMKILSGDVAPSQIAGGVILGAVIGLTPTFSLHNLLVLFLIIIIKVNISSVIFSALLFGIAGYGVDGLSHRLGRALLLSPSLEALWTYIYNTPLLALARFHNTVVLGSLLISLLIMVPLYLFSKKFVVYYRLHLHKKVEKLKIYKIIKSTKIYKFYARVKKVKL